MTTRSGSENRQRNQQLGVRFTQDEWDALTARCDRLGTEPAELLRSLAVEGGSQTSLSTDQRRRNRIALWRRELTELATGVGDGPEFRSPWALLDSLEADIRADERVLLSGRRRRIAKQDPEPQDDLFRMFAQDLLDDLSTPDWIRARLHRLLFIVEKENPQQEPSLARQRFAHTPDEDPPECAASGTAAQGVCQFKRHAGLHSWEPPAESQQE